MKIQAAVFFGGRSVEHEVSIISAMQAIAALDKEKYQPIAVYISKDGTFYTGHEFLSIEAYRDLPKLLGNGMQVTLGRHDGKAALLPATSKKIFSKDKPVIIDVAIPVVHGTFVEDGSLQGLFELVDVPYSGCDVLSSAVCMDKPASKTLLRAGGLPVLPDVVTASYEYYNNKDKILSEIEAKFPYPVIVKPVNLGSSVGISKAGDRQKLAEALEFAFSFAGRVLVEPAVVNLREINVSVLGSGESAKTSVCEEPVGQDEILSYKDKYLSGNKSKSQGMSSTKRKIPAELSAELENQIKSIALEAFRVLDCAGVVRIDFLLDGETVYINEFNTIPGSLSFYLWEPAGLAFTGLMDALVEQAFARKRSRGTLSFTYETNLLSTVNLGGAKGKA